MRAISNPFFAADDNKNNVGSATSETPPSDGMVAYMQKSGEFRGLEELWESE
jgi:hypothetical protein